MQMDGHGVSLVVFLDYTQSIGQPQPNAQTQDGWNNRQEFIIIIIIISVSICIRSAIIIIITAILVSLFVRIVVGVAVADFFSDKSKMKEF